MSYFINILGSSSFPLAVEYLVALLCSYFCTNKHPIFRTHRNETILMDLTSYGGIKSAIVRQQELPHTTHSFHGMPTCTF
mgnify:CR=1 FL=1